MGTETKLFQLLVEARALELHCLNCSMIDDVPHGANDNNLCEYVFFATYTWHMKWVSQGMYT